MTIATIKICCATLSLIAVAGCAGSAKHETSASQGQASATGQSTPKTNFIESMRQNESGIKPLPQIERKTVKTGRHEHTLNIGDIKPASKAIMVDGQIVLVGD